MAKAVGFSGTFFRAQDQAGLAAWYRTHLGVPELWAQDGGLAIFSSLQQTAIIFR